MSCKRCSHTTTQRGWRKGLRSTYVKKKFPPDQKRSTSGVIYAAFGEKIKNCLKNPELYSKEFRHYVNKKKFRVFEILSIGLKDVLVIPRSESDKEVW